MKNIKRVVKLLLLAAIAIIPNISQAAQSTQPSYLSYLNPFAYNYSLRRPRTSDVTRLGSYLWGTAREYPKTTLSLGGGLMGMGVASYFYNFYMNPYMQGALKAVKDLLTSESYIKAFLLGQGGNYQGIDIRLMNEIRGYSRSSSLLSHIGYRAPSWVPEPVSFLYIEPARFLQENETPANLLSSEKPWKWDRNFKVRLIMTTADRLATNDKLFSQEFLITLYNAVITKLNALDSIAYKKEIQKEIQNDYSALKEALEDPLELVKNVLSSSLFIKEYLLDEKKYSQVNKDLLMLIEFNLFYAPMTIARVLTPDLYEGTASFGDVRRPLIDWLIYSNVLVEPNFRIRVLSKIAEMIAKKEPSFANIFIIMLNAAIDGINPQEQAFFNKQKELVITLDDRPRLFQALKSIEKLR